MTDYKLRWGVLHDKTPTLCKLRWGDKILRSHPIFLPFSSLRDSDLMARHRPARPLRRRHATLALTYLGLLLGGPDLFTAPHSRGDPLHLILTTFERARYRTPQALYLPWIEAIKILKGNTEYSREYSLPTYHRLVI